MLTDDQATRVDDALGVRVAFARHRGGWVATNAPAVLVAQGRHPDVGAAASRVAEVLAEVTGRAPRILEDEELVALDAGDPALWDPKSWSFAGSASAARVSGGSGPEGSGEKANIPTALSLPVRDLLRDTASRLRTRSGSMTAAGAQATWETAFSALGEDVLVWSALRAAKPDADPLRVDLPWDVLESRLDANPLALVRRAHARLAADREAVEHDAAETGPVDHQASKGERTAENQAATADLCVHLALLPQTGRDTVRTGRTRPFILAVEALARAALAALEGAQPPDVRTDGPLFRHARRVLAETLEAAGVEAPVPY